MKKAVVIGSGNAFNSSGRAHACYLLENAAGELMLMDMGATSLMRLQQEGTDLNAVQFITFTHYHGDHYSGLPFVLLEMDLVRRREAPLTIAGPPGLRDAFARIMDSTYSGYEFRFEITLTEFSEPLRLGNFLVTPFPINHRPESTGYRVADVGPEAGSSTFAFSGDSAFDENLFRLVEDVDVAVIEMSMEEQYEKPVAHVTLREVLDNPGKLRARRVVWTHIYDELAEQVRKHDIGDVAHDGMVITFD